jgi:hypothetical protein
MNQGLGRGTAALAGISATTLQYVMFAIGVGLLVIWVLFLSGKDEYIGYEIDTSDVVQSVKDADRDDAKLQEIADNLSKYNFWISIILAMGVSLISASVAAKFVCSSGASGTQSARMYFGLCAIVGLIGAIAAFSAYSVPFAELGEIQQQELSGNIIVKGREAGGTSAPTFLMITGLMSVVCCLVGVAGVGAAAPAGKGDSPGFGFDFEF